MSLAWLNVEVFVLAGLQLFLMCWWWFAWTRYKARLGEHLPTPLSLLAGLTGAKRAVPSTRQVRLETDGRPARFMQ